MLHFDEVRSRPSGGVAIGFHNVALGCTQHELCIAIVDGVVVDVEAVHLGGDRGGVRN